VGKSEKKWEKCRKVAESENEHNLFSATGLRFFGCENGGGRISHSFALTGKPGPSRRPRKSATVGSELWMSFSTFGVIRGSEPLPLQWLASPAHPLASEWLAITPNCHACSTSGCAMAQDISPSSISSVPLNRDIKSSTDEFWNAGQID
jgi:hypothetical protein